ncbi:unnamed protein product, partial [Acanthocheilonema viteae]
MKRSRTVGSGENGKQSGRSSHVSRMQRWSLALRRHWFSSTSGRCRESTDYDFNNINPVEIIFAAPKKTVLGGALN